MPSSRATRVAPVSGLGRWGLSAFIVISYMVLAFQPDLRLAVPLMAGITGLVTGMLGICLYAGQKGAWRCSPGHVLVVSILVRALFLWRPVELSDDIYRYLWDGLRLLAGCNPYALAPAAVPPGGPLPAGLLPLVNHPHLTTIYPPAAQLVFSAGACLNMGIFGIKATLVLLDLFVCMLLLRLLPMLNKPAWMAVIYAWHPLPVLEIAASGHIDGAGIFFLLLALYLLTGCPGAHRRDDRNPRQVCRPFFSGVAFAFSVLTKLFPLVFLPGLLMLAGRSRRRHFCLGAAAATSALVLPFCPDIGNACGTLALYARTWEFSGFLYRVLSSSPLAGLWSRWLLGVAYLGVVIIAYRSMDKKRWSVSDPGRVFSTLCMGFLLLTPTLHPWYALYLVLFLPFSPGPGGLVLSWAVLLAYRVLISFTLLGVWVEDDLTALLIVAAPVAAWILRFLLRADQTAGGPLVTGRITP